MLRNDRLPQHFPGPGVRLDWHSYPKEKPTEKGIYLCYSLTPQDGAFWFNWWLGTRWKYHSGEMYFWTFMPENPKEAQMREWGEVIKPMEVQK
jgi:hypothetical protein